MQGKIILTMQKEVDGVKIERPVHAAFQFNDYGSTEPFAARDNFLKNDKKYFDYVLKELVEEIVKRL